MFDGIKSVHKLYSVTDWIEPDVDHRGTDVVTVLRYSFPSDTCNLVHVAPTLVTGAGKKFFLLLISENEVSLKLPAFWAAEPQIWFAQVKAQFALWKIVADNMKYFYVLSALDQATASRLKNFISNPPPRALLVEALTLSEPEWALLVLHFWPLGDT